MMPSNCAIAFSFWQLLWSENVLKYTNAEELCSCLDLPSYCGQNICITKTYSFIYFRSSTQGKMSGELRRRLLRLKWLIYGAILLWDFGFSSNLFIKKKKEKKRIIDILHKSLEKNNWKFLKSIRKVIVTLSIHDFCPFILLRMGEDVGRSWIFLFSSFQTSRDYHATISFCTPSLHLSNYFSAWLDDPNITFLFSCAYLIVCFFKFTPKVGECLPEKLALYAPDHLNERITLFNYDKIFSIAGRVLHLTNNDHKWLQKKY